MGNRPRTAHGTLTGSVGNVDLLRRTFSLFARVGPAEVRCVFPSLMGDNVCKADGRHVRVGGMLEYPGGGKFPDKLQVDRLDILDWKDPPSLCDLFNIQGCDPDERSTEEYLAELRSEWDA